MFVRITFYSVQFPKQRHLALVGDTASKTALTEAKQKVGSTPIKVKEKHGQVENVKIRWDFSIAAT